MNNAKESPRWLFVVKAYTPEPDANGSCVAKLRSELLKKGVKTDVLRIRLDRKNTPDAMEDEAGRIYSADTWMRLGHFGRFDSVSGIKKCIRLLRVVPARCWHYLTNGIYVDEKPYGKNACRGLKKRLEQLCGENRYDWVIAVCFPFSAQETAANADLGGARLAFYSLDPYGANYSHSDKNRAARLLEQAEATKRADVHFVSLEHRGDWEKPPLSECLSKIRCIPYPNLKKPDETVGSLPDGFFDNDKINCVYIGSLADGVRRPDGMLELFRRMAELRDDIRLYIIGKREGAQQAAAIEQCGRLMGEALVTKGTYDFDTAAAIMRNADVLVNIGNLVPNQMPSKLLDYIATGKPIICISEAEPCNMEPYWSRYPLMLRMDTAATADSRTAERAVEFCARNKGVCLEWEEIRGRYRGFIAEDVAQTIIDTLNAAQINQ